MTFIRWWTVGLMLMGATMAVTLGVVCLQYLVYMDSAPQLRDEWPTLMVSVGLFLALSAVAAVAWQALRRQSRWLWPAQGLLLISTAVVGLVFWRLLTV